jgi:hypothetical protein
MRALYHGNPVGQAFRIAVQSEKSLPPRGGQVLEDSDLKPTEHSSEKLAF